MHRHDSDSDNDYYDSRKRSDGVRASGWQSPIPTNDEVASSSSGIIRLVIDCPFGSKKCDYGIDKSQRGRLIVTARRRHIFKLDPISPDNPDNVVVQTFTIPYDADVDRLQSHVEHDKNRLIIEIPRLSSSYMNTTQTSSRFYPQSRNNSQIIVDDMKSSSNRNYYGDNQKLEYFVDCNGYRADELDVSIEDHDLIVHGKTRRDASPSSKPTRRHVSKEFTRKIILPNTVDLSKVISYLDNGQLRIEAPLKHDGYYMNDNTYFPQPVSTIMPQRTVVGYDRVQSPNRHRRHYRRHERTTRHRDLDRSLSPTNRIYSHEDVRYPVYRSLRDLDNEDYIRRNQNSRMGNYEHYVTNGNGTRLEPAWTYSYAPLNNTVRTIRTHRYYR